jgi:hypothetical protein
VKDDIILGEEVNAKSITLFDAGWVVVGIAVNNLFISVRGE